MCGACLLLTAACGGGGSTQPTPAPAPKAAPAATPAASTGSSAKRTRVTLQLPWLVGSYDTGYIVAKEMGYYKQAGFDVTIPEGKGTPVTAELVGKGSVPFGVVDASATSVLISKGLPAKMVAVYIQKSSNAFIYDNRHPFSGPRDLIGRTVVGSATADTVLLLPAVLKQYHISKSQLHLNMVPPSDYAQVFVTNPSAVLVAQADSAGYGAMLADKPHGRYKPYADFGVNLYADGLVTNTAMLSQHPGEIKRFVAASSRGWAYTVKHPKQAVSMVLKLFPHAKRVLIAGGLQIDLKSLHTPATQGHPLGWTAASDWSKMTQLLHRYGGLTKLLPPSSYYTDSFIPAS